MASPCPGIEEGLLPAKKVGSSKSSVIVDFGLEESGIVITLSISHIAKLALGLVVYNHLSSLPLIVSF